MQSRQRENLLLILSAALTAAGYAPINLWYLSFLGPALFLWLIPGGRPFKKGYIFGFFYAVMLVHWIAFNSGAAVWMVTLSMFAAAAFLALNYAAIAWLFNRIYRVSPQRALFAAPFIWTAVEFIRSYGVLSFPWMTIGNTQSANLLFIQMADIGGIYLISFFIMTAAALITAAARRLIPVRLFSAVLLMTLILPYIYGGIRISQVMATGETLNFRLVQPNYDSHEKWKRSNRDKIFADMDSLSRADGVLKPDIILWPESATPVYVRTNKKYRNILQNIVEETGAVLITGTPDYERGEDGIIPYNSLLAFEKGRGLTSIYHKVNLVPFGEYIPFSDRFPALKNLNLGQANFIPGKKNVDLVVNDSLRLVPVICYESIYPIPVVKSVRRGSDAILNVTNDSWFGPSLGPYQHASQSVFRAVETRKPLLRAANTGISLVIDPQGRILDSLGLYEKSFIDVKVAFNDSESIYVRFGNIFAILTVIVAICFYIPLCSARFFS